MWISGKVIHSRWWIIRFEMLKNYLDVYNPQIIHKLSTKLSTKKVGLSTESFDHIFSKLPLDICG